MRWKRFLIGLIALCFAGAWGSTQAQEKKGAPKVCWKTPPAPWFDTRDCPSKAQPQVLSTGEFGENHTVICKTIILFCGQTLTKYKTLADNTGAGGHCPTSIDYSLPDVCCAKLEQAVKTKKPCDPLVDANCDGTANTDDADPLFRRGVPQDYIWVDSPSGEAFATNYLNQKTPLAHCTRLKMANYTPSANGYNSYAVNRDGALDYSDVEERFISCKLPSGCSKSAAPPSCGDGTKGIVFGNPDSGTSKLFTGPSNGSPLAGELYLGSRVVFKETVVQDGTVSWYHVYPLGALDGWVRAQDVSCTRPSIPILPPTRLHHNDVVPAATGASPLTSAARG